MSFEEQIVSLTDMYLSIFSHEMGAIVFIMIKSFKYFSQHTQLGNMTWIFPTFSRGIFCYDLFDQYCVEKIFDGLLRAIFSSHAKHVRHYVIL